jgi:hypothetical protein
MTAVFVASILRCAVRSVAERAANCRQPLTNLEAGWSWFEPSCLVCACSNWRGGVESSIPTSRRVRPPMKLTRHFKRDEASNECPQKSRGPSDTPGEHLWVMQSSLQRVRTSSRRVPGANRRMADPAPDEQRTVIPRIPMNTEKWPTPAIRLNYTNDWPGGVNLPGV